MQFITQKIPDFDLLLVQSQLQTSNINKPILSFTSKTKTKTLNTQNNPRHAARKHSSQTL